MIGKDRYKVKITTSFDDLHIPLSIEELAYPTSLLPTEKPSSFISKRMGRRDIIDDTVESCLRNLEKTYSKKVLFVLKQNDNRDTVTGTVISLMGEDEIENPAFGELEDGTKVIVVPAVLGDNGIELIGTEFIVKDQDVVKYSNSDYINEEKLSAFLEGINNILT